MTRSVRFRLEDIRTTIADARAFLAGRTSADFLADALLQRALERSLEIISEASRHLPDEMKSREPDIPWRRVADIGNVLRHVYQHIDPRLIWNIAEHELPRMEAAVLRLLALQSD